MRLFFAIASMGLVVGCAQTAEHPGSIFSISEPLIAVIGDEIFSGEATGYLDGTGTIRMQSQKDPNLKCIGDFHYVSSKSGTGSATCIGGTRGLLVFQALSNLSGYGTAISDRGPVSFAYGLSLEDSSKYLRIPEGKKLARKGDVLEWMAE